MAPARDQLIETMCSLLEAQGYHGTGLNQILRESGAPRGSLYYYFPEGKEELAAEAITRTGTHMAAHVRAELGASTDVAAALTRFVLRIAAHIEGSGFCKGGPLTAVAMETAASSERLNLACRDAFIQLEAAFADGLSAGGVAPERAASLATVIVAAIEGGIILSRTYHCGGPLRRVAAELPLLLA
jgi:TetR/AcrR family transcriptional regulator, lmrAB and yxaGH operons repressor